MEQCFETCLIHATDSKCKHQFHIQWTTQCITAEGWIKNDQGFQIIWCYNRRWTRILYIAHFWLALRSNHDQKDHKKEVNLEYVLGFGDYSQCAGHNEREQGAVYITGISDAFETPPSATDNSLIWPAAVINSLSFSICKMRPSDSYYLLKYALSNYPYLQLLILDFPSVLCSIEIHSLNIIRNNPWSRTSQKCWKIVRFEGPPPTEDILNLISSTLPNVEKIDCTKRALYGKDINTRQQTSFTFNLIPFQKLKSFHMSIEIVVNSRWYVKVFDYLFVQFKYTVGEEAFYCIPGEINLTNWRQRLKGISWRLFSNWRIYI